MDELDQFDNDLDQLGSNWVDITGWLVQEIYESWSASSTDYQKKIKYDKYVSCLKKFLERMKAQNKHGSHIKPEDILEDKELALAIVEGYNIKMALKKINDSWFFTLYTAACYRLTN